MKRQLFILIILIISQQATCQVVQGYIIDSHTQDSLFNVHIINNVNNSGTISDLQGFFTVEASINDTLYFSSVGYHTYKYVITRGFSKNLLIIPMVSDTILLPEIEILSNHINILLRDTEKAIRIPGVSYNNTKPLKPMATIWGNNLEDDSNIIPVFGPKGTLVGPFSYFSKKEKRKSRFEKRKGVRHSEKNYNELINSGEVKEMITSSFNLSSQEYDSLLIRFNINNQENIKNSSEEALVSMLFHYFNENKK